MAATISAILQFRMAFCRSGAQEVHKEVGVLLMADGPEDDRKFDEL